MRLEELTGIKTAVAHYGPLQHFKQIEYVLAGYGFTKLGGGAYANVFAHPNFDYVLKVFHRLDYGYLTFLRYVMANQGNPALPRIIGQPKKLSTDTTDSEYRNLREWYFVRIEQLTPLRMSENTQFFDGMYTFIYTVVKSQKSSDDPTLNATPDQLKRVRAWESQYPYHATAIYDLGKMVAVSDDFSFDLHDENLMKRGNQIVITDPLS